MGKSPFSITKFMRVLKRLEKYSFPTMQIQNALSSAKILRDSFETPNLHLTISSETGAPWSCSPRASRPSRMIKSRSYCRICCRLQSKLIDEKYVGKIIYCFPYHFMKFKRKFAKRIKLPLNPFSWREESFKTTQVLNFQRQCPRERLRLCDRHARRPDLEKCEADVGGARCKIKNFCKLFF